MPRHRSREGLEGGQRRGARWTPGSGPEALGFPRGACESASAIPNGYRESLRRQVVRLSTRIPNRHVLPVPKRHRSVRERENRLAGKKPENKSQQTKRLGPGPTVGFCAAASTVATGCGA